MSLKGRKYSYNKDEIEIELIQTRYYRIRTNKRGRRRKYENNRRTRRSTKVIGKGGKTFKHETMKEA